MTSWIQRLRKGLSKSSDKITSGISSIFTDKNLSDEMLDELEELLIVSDMGFEAASEITDTLRSSKYHKDITLDDVKKIISDNIANILKSNAELVDISSEKPFVILVAGVNGSGKTTTIGKMSHMLKDSDFSVMMAACDTFRAAAVEQLKIWGDRTNVPVITGDEGQDPASVAYQALEKAKHDNIDVLLIDTAGRLQNKSGLMAELEKIIRVIKKLDDTAPHSSILVLDASVGQNAHSQVETFSKVANITGLVVTKLDGTAKGGIIVALSKKYDLPIHSIGVGEGIEDLKPFDPHDFSKSLLGIK